MMTEQVKIIALISTILVFINILVFMTLNIRSSFKNRLERLSLYFWCSLLPIFIIGASLQDQTYVPFVTAFSVIAFSIIREMFLGSEHKKKRSQYVMLGALTTFFFSAIYFNITKDIITSAIMISLALNTHICESIYSIVFEIKKRNIYQKIVLIPFFIGLYNNVAPILGQIDKKFDLAGWLTALFLYQTISILFPIYILERRKEKEKVILAQEVAKETEKLVIEKAQITQRHQESVILAQENQYLFNTLSHDIANPILGIRLLTGRLIKNNKGEHDLKSLQMIKDNIEIAVKFIQVAKAQRKLIAQKDTLNLSLIDINSSLEKCEELNSIALAEKEIELTAYTEGEIKKSFLADQSIFVLSILNNIINNAVKFTPVKGKINLTVSQETNFICFKIQDTGPGISEKALAEINEKGFTTSSSGTSGEKGSGFGISNAKRYIEKYNGHIHFSTNSIGTQVKISFPVASRSAGSIREQELAQTPKPQVYTEHHHPIS